MLSLLIAGSFLVGITNGFSINGIHRVVGGTRQKQNHASFPMLPHSWCLQMSPSSSSTIQTTTTERRQEQIEILQQQVAQLKQVLKQEYESFFDPMERQYYNKNVIFQDPLNSIEGIDSYQGNVDMLAARTLLGKFLFRNANIVLHNIQGGEIVANGDQVQISNLVTRWTLSMTMSVLPWQPTARFTGISVYQVRPKLQQTEPNSPLIEIIQQNDYWDSINLVEGGSYVAVDKWTAVQDFVNQLLEPNTAPTTSSSSNELSYQLLRRAKEYQVRRYPSYKALFPKNTVKPCGMGTHIRESCLQTLRSNRLTLATFPFMRLSQMTSYQLCLHVPYSRFKLPRQYHTF